MVVKIKEDIISGDMEDIMNTVDGADKSIDNTVMTIGIESKS